MIVLFLNEYGESLYISNFKFSWFKQPTSKVWKKSIQFYFDRITLTDHTSMSVCITNDLQKRRLYWEVHHWKSVECVVNHFLSSETSITQRTVLNEENLDHVNTIDQQIDWHLADILADTQSMSTESQLSVGQHVIQVDSPLVNSTDRPLAGMSVTTWPICCYQQSVVYRSTISDVCVDMSAVSAYCYPLLKLLK